METPLPPHYAAHQLPDPNLFHSSHPTLVSQPDLSLEAFHFDPQLENQPGLPLQNRQSFEPNSFDSRTPQQPRFQEIRPGSGGPISQATGFSSGSPYGINQRDPRQRTNEQNRGAQAYGILNSHQQLPSHPQSHSAALSGLQHEIDLRPQPAEEGVILDTHFSNLKFVPNPPNLEEWRQRLFDVNETITLTEDEFTTYFPHVDNIYSHRSSQKGKRKPFISHYWDCRLKGRPPGTAKSDDPNKKKRKRQARARDLCDVKIKITEYFPGARASMGTGNTNHAPADHDDPLAGTHSLAQQRSDLSKMTGSVSTHPTMDSIGSSGTKYYTIQRVNGNGANGKPESVPGGHKHTLEESDRIKKNSIYRHYMKEEKERRKSNKTYHKKATGLAFNTVKKHSKDHELKLYGSCFCPFVQRVWISLEVKGLSYQYIEVDPYKKPEELLAMNPRGLVPALQHGGWSCYESSVLMEYLEDLNAGLPLLPFDNPPMRAHCRLWSDHINRKILPHFYGLLQAQEQPKQIEEASALKADIAKIVEAADRNGPFFLGPHISFVDIQFAPWIVRLRKVLTPYRAWPEPEPGSRWASWVNAVENNEGVKATTSSDDLYIDSYERYAENRPNTSELAKAINEGRGLP